jgi:outer membrane protein OmpA-like peptidoglycan-associated protein
MSSLTTLLGASAVILIANGCLGREGGPSVQPPTADLSSKVMDTGDAQETGEGDGGSALAEAGHDGWPSGSAGPCTDASGPHTLRWDGPLIIAEPRVVFAINSLRLNVDQRARIDAVAALLNRQIEIRLVEVEGHATRAEGRSGMRLAHDRAALVVRMLIERGVAPGRLTTKAYEAEPEEPMNAEPTVTFRVVP